MFFSVIIPIYNVEEYLCECIESILGQSYKNYEIILVDDGSKDKSGEICDGYSRKYPNTVKVLHKPNGGQSDARNMGMESAVGDYIVYIDSDDFIISADFLKDVHDEIEECDSDIVLYKFQKYRDGRLENCTFSLSGINAIENGDELLFELVRRDAYYGMAWIKAFRRDIATKNQVIFDTNLSCEDMDWYFALLLHADKVSAIDKPYIAYRQRGGSITTTQKLKNLTDFIYILEKRRDIILQADISETKRNALMGALAKYYSNLLVTYVRLKDKEKKGCVERIKKLSSLLDYSLSNRPLKIKKIYGIVGFSGVVFLLKFYDRVK